jgi:hypothetical protein
MSNRRRLLAFCVACLLVLATIIFMHIGSAAPAPPSLRETNLGAHSPSSDEVLLSDPEDSEIHLQEWEKDFSRYGLTASQCSSEFKTLFHEIERAVSHRNKIGNVKESDIDLNWKSEGAMRAMIYNQKVALPDVL